MKSLALIILGSGVLFFVAIHIVWRIPPSNIKDMTTLNAELTNGQPTVLELYSNL